MCCVDRYAAKWFIFLQFTDLCKISQTQQQKHKQAAVLTVGSMLMSMHLRFLQRKKSVSHYIMLRLPHTVRNKL